MADYKWPWQYNFPPFFTIQPNLDTRKKQVEAWRSLILNYYRVHKLFVLDVTEAQNSPLFYNANLDRKITGDSLYVILEDLRQKGDKTRKISKQKFLKTQKGNLEWLDKSKKRCYIYWRTPEEWGKLIYRWVNENGMTNSVCTLYEIINGDDSINEEFHGLDERILVRALRTLETEKKAELFTTDGNEGVKFF